MKKTITHWDFIEAFRGTYCEGAFSMNAKMALYDYLTEYEEETGEELELDVVALNCEYTEYYDFDDIKGDYSEYFEEEGIESLDDLAGYTTVIEFDDGVLIGEL